MDTPKNNNSRQFGYISRNRRLSWLEGVIGLLRLICLLISIIVFTVAGCSNTLVDKQFAKTTLNKVAGYEWDVC